MIPHKFVHIYKKIVYLNVKFNCFERVTAGTPDQLLLKEITNSIGPKYG